MGSDSLQAISSASLEFIVKHVRFLLTIHMHMHTAGLFVRNCNKLSILNVRKFWAEMSLGPQLYC